MDGCVCRCVCVFTCLLGTSMVLRLWLGYVVTVKTLFEVLTKI